MFYLSFMDKTQNSYTLFIQLANAKQSRTLLQPSKEIDPKLFSFSEKSQVATETEMF